MSDKQLLLWRANHYDGKLSAWQACYGFKPFGMYGGNEYIEYIPKEDLTLANETLRSVIDDRESQWTRAEYLQSQLDAEKDRTKRLKNIINNELLR